MKFNIKAIKTVATKVKTKEAKVKFSPIKRLALGRILPRGK